MNPESSPFTPGQPVPIEFFVGRIHEIQRLQSMVKASLRGRLKIGFVTGERGIGKSSLASFVRHLAEKENSVIGSHIFLGGVRDLPEMVRQTFDRLLKESVDKSWHQDVRDFFGDYVREVGLFGISIELNLKGRDLNTLVQDFVPSLKRLLNKVKKKRSSILLILDDINGLASCEPFANWLKSTVDEISTSKDKFPLCIILVGLEERRQELISAQPSLARVFQLIEINPWSSEETSEFFTNSFDKASAIADGDALSFMVNFSGGLPVLAHEIGDQVWLIAESTNIKVKEAINGIVNAAEVIGRKLLRPQVFQALRSDKYRSILSKVGGYPGDLKLQRADLLSRLNVKEKKVLDNFLRRMRELGALKQDPEGGRGSYCFLNHLHALYFMIESHNIKEKNDLRSR